MNNRSQFKRMIIVVLMMIVVSLSGCKKGAKDAREVKYFKIKPSDKELTKKTPFFHDISAIETIEIGSDNIAVWAKNGIRDKTLLLFDSSINIQHKISDEYLNETKNLIDSDNYELLSKFTGLTDKYKRFYSHTDYIYAAHRLGIIKDVVWVLPIEKSITSDYKDYFKLQLKAASPYYTQEDIDSFTLSDNQLKGRIFDIPITVVAIKDFKPTEEPFVVSINLTYINAFIIDNVKTPVEDVTVAFLNAFQSKSIYSNYITIVNSNQTFEVTMLFRFISAIVEDIIRTPVLVSAPKKEWIIKQAADKKLAFVEYDMAEKEYYLILETTPDDPSIYFQLAFIKSKRGDYEEASRLIEKAMEYDKYYVLSYVFFASKTSSSDNTLEILRLGNKNHPKDIPILSTLASRLFEKGEYKEALAIYKRLIGLGVESYDLSFYIADCYERLKEYDKAIDTYNKTFSILTKDMVFYYSFYYINLAELYEKKGDKENAIRYYNLFLKLNKASSETDIIKLKVKRLKNK